MSQILVHGSAASTEALLQNCSAIRFMTRDICAPLQGEQVQIGEHVNSYSLSLDESLVGSLKMSRVSCDSHLQRSRLNML